MTVETTVRVNNTDLEEAIIALVAEKLDKNPEALVLMNWTENSTGQPGAVLLLKSDG